MVINDKLILVGGLEPWNFMTFHVLGMSSSQLTFIFFRGVGQPPIRWYEVHLDYPMEKAVLRGLDLDSGPAYV